jgi:transposase-like protein
MGGYTWDDNPSMHVQKQFGIDNDRLALYAKEIKEIVDQGILLWNIIYATVLKYKENYQDSWYFVKHEELSQRPFTEFEKIFQFLNLRFDKNVKDQIKKSTQAKTTSEFNRNSIENIKSWKEDLSVDEISQIKLGTMSVWHKYYDKRDW